jgi:hypothetical protein
MANQVQGTAHPFSRSRGAKKIPAREEFTATPRNARLIRQHPPSFGRRSGLE